MGTEYGEIAAGILGPLVQGKKFIFIGGQLAHGANEVAALGAAGAMLVHGTSPNVQLPPGTHTFAMNPSSMLLNNMRTMWTRPEISMQS